VRTVRAAGRVGLPPDRALGLWSDPDRWHAWVEGFARVVERDPGWPALGAAVVWESGPEGRGRVVERVVEHLLERRFATEVTERSLGGGEPRLHGRQTLELAEQTGEGSQGSSSAELRLDYELTRGRGSPGAITDLLFVRRALRDALARTLERFAAEAAREAAR
jgi:hypothetical protein